MPRLFIALPVPDDVAGRLMKVMAPDAEGWRWVRPESLHLTLVFLGDVDERAVETVGKAIRRAAAQAAPIELTARSLGAFPSAARAKILWAGIDGELPALHALHSRLEREFRAEGLRFEERTYRPHVTLARSRAPRRIPTHLDLHEALGAWTAQDVVLYESQLSSSGPRYVVRTRASLGSGT